MTKTQVKAVLRKALKQWESIKDMLDELAMDVQDTIDEIEPYGDSWELTEQQQERQDWLQEVLDTLSYIDDGTYTMEELEQYVEE